MDTLNVKILGKQDYTSVWHAMRDFTLSRLPEQTDELWIVEHPPVFTQGQAGRPEHLLAPGDIPVIQIDRGGQITYHGPGQLVAYPLIDIKRKNLGPRQLVTHLENILIQCLSHWQIDAKARPDAPGVYIDNKKIASIGLRIKNKGSYHGIALNVKMDLSPFQRINPCGFKNMEMTQMSEFVSDISIELASKQFINEFCKTLEYTIAHSDERSTTKTATDYD